jgi:hypothetical protein
MAGLALQLCLSFIVSVSALRVTSPPGRALAFVAHADRQPQQPRVAGSVLAQEPSSRARAVQVVHGAPR